ncbi:plasmid fertility inhibition factor family protein [Pararobbsia alpina]|uniref:Uncharacterized protein n=1 Tax=Pararobbsia alpina TaxID=621374 RepID=A0A6S7BN06_9BURK|nr:hypothetical protein [Pararobbsia alpina]CAB3796723.1 hypothetical protein LMG28138_04139 [Pararobbsia alpina]
MDFPAPFAVPTPALSSEPPSAPDESDIWTVALTDHAAFSFVRLKRVFTLPGSRHVVVLVDAKALLACADRDPTDYVLPAVPYWPPGKVKGLREFLEPGQARMPEMPYVLFSTRRTPGFVGLLGLSHDGVVSFRNGQHRARYMAYAGAECFPVEVHETEAEALRKYCGWVGVARS